MLWTAGVEAPALAGRWPRPPAPTQDRAGRIKVEPDLTLPGHPEIFVVGDVMRLGDLPGPGRGGDAVGAYAGRRIRRQVRAGRSRKPFRYIDLGSAAYITRGRAVVSAGPLQLSGRLGWLTWLFIHIAFLTGYRNRFTAVMTWLVAFSRGVRRERAFTTQEIETRQEVFKAG